MPAQASLHFLARDHFDFSREEEPPQGMISRAGAFVRRQSRMPQHDQQVNIAVGVGLPISVRAIQVDFLWLHFGNEASDGFF